MLFGLPLFSVSLWAAHYLVKSWDIKRWTILAFAAKKLDLRTGSSNRSQIRITCHELSSLDKRRLLLNSVLFGIISLILDISNECQSLRRTQQLHRP